MMINLPDLNPAPIVRRVCPTCENPVDRRQVSVPKGVIHAAAFRWWCYKCRKFTLPKIITIDI